MKAGRTALLGMTLAPPAPWAPRSRMRNPCVAGQLLLSVRVPKKLTSWSVWVVLCEQAAHSIPQ